MKSCFKNPFRLAAALPSASLVLVGQLNAQTTLTINASASGSYDNTGYHDPADMSYGVGENISGSGLYRDFFVFSIPAFQGVVTSAQLLINSYTNASPTGVETYELHDVTSSIAALVSGGSGLTAIYNDLADGALYGTRNVQVSDTGTVVTIPLGTAFVNAVVAASGGQIALGGSISTLDPTPNNEYLFQGGSAQPGDVRLQLSVASSVETNAASRGSYNAHGTHFATNTSYYVSATNHNYFVFSIPRFSGSIVEAELLLNCYSNGSPSGANLYFLRQVVIPLSIVTNNASTGTNAYNDLGDGTVFATRNILVSESGLTAIIPLNAAFIQSANSVGGGQIALGGSIYDHGLGPDQSCFGSSSNGLASDARLRLTFGTSYSIMTTNKGWYDSSGFNDPNNKGYGVGENDVGSTILRDFFAFHLPALSGQLIKAQLLLYTAILTSPEGVETYELHDVTTPIPTLLAGGSGLTNIYDDLADGILYGGREIYVSESPYIAAVPLNGAFKMAAAAASGSDIALGGSISTLDPTPNNELYFGGGGGAPQDTVLFLGLITNLQSSPSLVPPYMRLPTGEFLFSLLGAGSSYEIQFSADLENWDYLSDITMTNSTTVVVDPTPGSGPRFYRARQLP
jgi:hypothetical protein